MQTNIQKITLGAWAWGNDGTFGGSLTEQDLRPIFDAAMDKGLTLWDTAYVYGMGTSERTLGTFLRTVPRENYQISAKFTPQCANPAAENAVIEMYKTSAELLGTDYMDYYWIHNPVGAPKWITELIPLAKTGKIGKIGVSNHNLSEIKQANEILNAGGLKIGAVQNHYSLLNRSSETSGILDYCTFSKSIENYTQSGGSISFDVRVTNTGSVAGKDVAEIYFTPPYYNGGIEKSSVNLLDFAKTELLEPGASTALHFEFNGEDMASFDTYGEGCYVLEAGNYNISLRENAHSGGLRGLPGGLQCGVQRGKSPLHGPDRRHPAVCRRGGKRDLSVPGGPFRQLRRGHRRPRLSDHARGSEGPVYQQLQL